MKKMVVGITGYEELVKDVVQIFEDTGFYTIILSERVQDFAQYPLKDDFDTSNLMQIRKRGIDVCKAYWVNLSLTSLPKDKDLIVIEDLLPEEISSTFQVYQVLKPSETSELAVNGVIVKDEKMEENLVDMIEKLLS